MGEIRCPHCNTEVDEHEANRCLDAWVAEAVMGYDDILMPDAYGRAPEYQHVEGLRYEIPQYSTSTAAAWETVERAKLTVWPTKQGNWFVFDGPIDETYGDEWWFGGDGKHGEGELPEYGEVSSSAPLAICRAALKGLGE